MTLQKSVVAILNAADPTHSKEDYKAIVRQLEGKVQVNKSARQV